MRTLISLQEQSNAGKGALVGGAIGLYSGKGKPSGTKFRKSAGGRNTHIRQVARTNCDPASAADTDEAVERAVRKISILCDT